jgi:hypothetical protein
MQACNNLVLNYRGWSSLSVNAIVYVGVIIRSMEPKEPISCDQIESVEATEKSIKRLGRLSPLTKLIALQRHPVRR